jgi:hypothetical protein
MNKFNKNKQSRQIDKKKHNNNIVKIPRMYNQNILRVDIEATQTVYLRTGQTIASFAPGSQLYYVNLNTVVLNSNNIQKFFTGGIPNFEMIRITGYTMTWYPALIQPVTSTFEPVAFDIRHITNYSINTFLPGSYQANYNEAQYSALLQQTSRPRTTIFSLPSQPVILSDAGYPCIGQYVTAYTFAAAAANIGGTIHIIQSTPSTNTIALYNPKLGFFELKFHVELYNSLV